MSWTTDRNALLDDVERVYQELVATRRQVRPDDRLFDDLEIGSLLAQELLIVLEDRHGVELIGNPAVARISTVGELVAVLEEAIQSRR